MTISPQMIHQLEELIKKERSFQRLWNAASAWLTLGEESQELCDLKRSLELFRLAHKKKKGVDPLFFLSYGEALLTFGSFMGDPLYVKEGLELLRLAISKKAHRAWICYALGHKLLYELTGSAEDFQEADRTFQRAIMAVPQQGELWLAWGALFLESSWRQRQVGDVEIALEKFTSLKMDDCEPPLVTAYLSEALAILGLFLDDLKMIHDAKQKLYLWLNQHQKVPQLLISAGMLQLVEGSYFSDPSHFASAIDFFYKALEKDSRNMRARSALFQSYLLWGTLFQDSLRIQEAERQIEQLSNLRPFSSIHLLDWGMTLLRLCEFERDEMEQQALCEEAIDKFRRAIQLGGGLESHFQLAAALDLLGDLTGVEEYFEEAIEILRRLHALQPQDGQLIFQLALALSHYGELQAHVESLYEAVKLFESIAEVHPEDDELFCHLGYTELLLSEHTYDENHLDICMRHRAQAEKHLIHASSLGSSDSNYHLACLYSLCGMIEQALVYLKRADRLQALPSAEALLHDHWIENLRAHGGFTQFMEERYG